MNSNNDDESIFLKDLDNFIINKKNLSNKLIDDFNKKYINNLDLILMKKRFKVAIQMDPLEKINPNEDSTFVIAKEAQDRGYKISIIYQKIYLLKIIR